MTLSTKKVNITYAAYLLICVPLTLFMLLSGIIVGLGAANSVDYDTVLTLGSTYYIKIHNAVYIEDENVIKFTLSSKLVENVQATGEPPKVITVWLDSINNDIDYTAQQLDSISTEYTCKLPDKQKEYRRLIVRVQYKLPDEKMPDTTDAFGATVEGETKKGSEYVERITIGRKDITKMSAEENKNTVTEKVVLTTTTKVTEKADSSSENDSSEGATTTTKNSTTAETTTTKAPTQATTTTKNSESTSDSTSTAAQSGGGNTAKNTTRVTTKGTTKNTVTTTAKTTTKATSKPQTTTTAAVGAKPTGVSMRTNSSTYDIYLTVGQTHNVQAVVTPTSAEQGVAWSSLRPNVATVDSNGKIKAVGKGTTIITCTTKNGGLKASCMVTVN